MQFNWIILIPSEFLRNNIYINSAKFSIICFGVFIISPKLNEWIPWHCFPLTNQQPKFDVTVKFTSIAQWTLAKSDPQLTSTVIYPQLQKQN